MDGDREQLLAVALHTWRTTKPGSLWRASVRMGLQQWREQLDIKPDGEAALQRAEKTNREHPPPIRSFRISHVSGEIVHVSRRNSTRAPRSRRTRRAAGATRRAGGARSCARADDSDL